MKVDMDLLKQLRNLTFAPLKDCKDALIESEGDLDKAQNILKEKGILKAAKKADRETKEGLIKVVQEGNYTYGIKMGCETDFVAKNELFLNLLDNVIVLLKKYGKEISSLEMMDQDYLENVINNLIKENIGSIGENIRLIDAFILSGNAYVYNHPGNKLVAVVFYEGSDTNEVSKELALQIAAMNPLYKSIDDIDSNYKDSLKVEFQEELKNTGKSTEMLEKIIEGKLVKKYSEIVLLEQPYIRDEIKKIKNIIPTDYKLLKYIRFSI